MATITNPYSGLNPYMGTGQRESTGQSLANIVTASLGAYAKVQEIDKQYTEQEKQELNLAEKTAYSDITNRQNTEYYNALNSDFGDDKLADIRKTHNSELEEFSSVSKSEWMDLNKHNINNKYSSQIIKHSTLHDKKRRNEFVDNRLTSLSFDGNVSPKTFDELSKESKTTYNDAIKKDKLIEDFAIKAKGYILSSNESIDTLKSKYSSFLDNDGEDIIYNIKARTAIKEAINSKISLYSENKYSEVLDYTNADIPLDTAERENYYSKIKELKKEVNSDKSISVAYRERMDDELSSVLKSKDATTSKLIKRVLGDGLEVAKNTFSSGVEEYSISEKYSSVDRNMADKYKKLSVLKKNIYNSVKSSDIENINKMLLQNGTVKDDKGNIVAYKSSEAKNLMQNYITSKIVEAESLVVPVGATEQQSKDTRMKRDRIVNDVLELESKIDGLDSTFTKRLTGLLTDDNYTFSDFDKIEGTIDIARSSLKTLGKNSPLYRRSFDVLASKYTSLVNRYGEKDKDTGEITISNEDKNKIMISLNRAKSDTIQRYNTEVSLKRSQVKELQNNRMWRTDEREDGIYEGMTYALSRENKTQQEIKNMETDDMIDYLDKHTDKYAPSSFVSSIWNTFFSDSGDAIRIPKSDNIRRALDTIIGKKIETENGERISIPDFEDMNIRINSENSISILEKDTNAVVFVIDKKTSGQIEKLENFKILD